MLGLGGHATAQQPVVHHKTVKVGELDIFYREAGPKDAPAILLLQGFPTSSQMFRNLIPALADRYRVVAPDYVQDYGAPVGYRLAVAHPERVTAIVVQNGNAYDKGLDNDFWKPIKAYWKESGEAGRSTLLPHLRSDQVAVHARREGPRAGRAPRRAGC